MNVCKGSRVNICKGESILTFAQLLKDLSLRLSVADIFKTHALGSCVAGRVS